MANETELILFHSLKEYEDRFNPAGDARLALTLGKFDGIHLGHQKLIKRVTDKASALDLTPAVLAIGMNSSGILTDGERADILETMGVAVLIECPFTKEFMMMTPRQFAQKVLAQCLQASFLAVGADYRFGHGRAGDAAMLKELGSEYGYETDIISKEMYLGQEISSTRIRSALTKGDMESVSQMLGRSYAFTGTVNHGRHIGTGIGMPTVNLFPPDGKILPPDGVYVTRTYLKDGQALKGVTNIGFRPTVNGKHRTIETTLLDFDADLYGQQIRTELIHYIRQEIRFDSLEDLKRQVDRDIAVSAQYF